MREAAKKALIYCRVSSTKQLDEGDGLSSQQLRCEEYARRKGYEIINEYHDKGVSGGMLDRPAMQKMLGWLLAQETGPYVVIIDDLSRFSRDVTVHWKLRELLEKAGGILESPTVNFGHTSDDKLVENLLASVSQHQREKIAETSASRMKARIKNGWWVFRTLPGYRYVQTKGNGKILMRDEPIASIVVEALEGYAMGRLGSQADVRRFFEAQPEFPKPRHGRISPQKVYDLMTHPLYAGFVHAPTWGIPLRKGNHEALISTDTFERIKQRLNGHSYAPRRAEVGEKFALRGFVTCGDCNKPYRACESKSCTGKRHAYYLCHTKGCASYGKSIRRDVIEGEFEDLLKTMRPTPGLIGLVRAMFKDAWTQRSEQLSVTKRALAKQISKLEREIDNFLDRIGETGSAHAAKAYERKIERLEKDKLLKQEKLGQMGIPANAASKNIELALGFLSNPWKIWISGNSEHRKLVLKLAFAERLPYQRKEGYRTPQASVIFRFLGNFGQNLEMVPGGGIEPPTRGFSIHCSTPELPGHGEGVCLRVCAF